jgi:hypothetical protein
MNSLGKNIVGIFLCPQILCPRTPSPQGDQGPQGSPGEVSAQQLAEAIGGTANDCNSVQPLNLSVSDPPTQSDLQAVANKLDELIQALRR